MNQVHETKTSDRLDDKPATPTAWSKWLLAAAVIVVLVGGTSFISRRLASWETPSAADAVSPSAGNQAVEQVELHTAQQIQSDARSLARIKLVELRDATADALTKTDALQNTLTRWDTDVVALLKNDRGRFIAGDAAAVKSFNILFSEGLPERPNIEAIRSRLKGTTSFVDTRLSDSLATNSPDAEMLQSVTRERDSARKLGDEWQKRLDDILSLAASAERSGKKGTSDLATVLEDLRAREASARAASIEERLAAVRKDEDDRAVATQSKLIKENSERDRLKKLAGDQAVQAKFHPFLDKGRWQWNQWGGQVFDFPQPVSFAVLSQSGALQSPLAFVQAGAGRAETWRRNDRPHWSYPTTAEELAKYSELLDQFKELAPVWIEMGLLSK